MDYIDVLLADILPEEIIRLPGASPDTLRPYLFNKSDFVKADISSDSFFTETNRINSDCPESVYWTYDLDKLFKAVIDLVCELPDNTPYGELINIHIVAINTIYSIIDIIICNHRLIDFIRLMLNYNSHRMIRYTIYTTYYFNLLDRIKSTEKFRNTVKDKCVEIKNYSPTEEKYFFPGEIDNYIYFYDNYPPVKI